MSEAARLPLHRRPAFWAGGIFAAFGIISALRMTDAIGSTTGFILMVIAMLQIIPLTRASLAKQRSTGHLSPAIVRYTRRFLLASFGYMLGLGIAVTIADRVDLSEIESFLIALLPVIPVLGMIWTMARYLIEEEDAEEFAKEHFGGALQHFGRMTAFHGQMGMFTRALAYILSHGADGLKQVAEDAVLNANYILRSLDDVLDAPFGPSGPCMHEALFSDKGFAEGLSTLDLAKAMIDEGYHPMTMYFPLVVHGAMLVEPTETESKAALDQFIMALRSVAERAKEGDESLKTAPHYAPRRRLDETQAARKPVLAWNDPDMA